MMQPLKTTAANSLTLAAAGQLEADDVLYRPYYAINNIMPLRCRPVDIADLQAFQTRVFASMSEKHKHFVVPRTADSQQQVLNAGGALYCIKQQQAIVASMACLRFAARGYEAEIKFLSSSGQALQPQEDFLWLSTVLFDRQHFNAAIAELLLASYLQEALYESYTVCAFTVVAENYKFLEQVFKFGFKVIAVGEHTVLKNQVFLLAKNLTEQAQTALQQVPTAVSFTETAALSALLAEQHAIIGLDLRKQEFYLAPYQWSGASYNANTTAAIAAA